MGPGSLSSGSELLVGCAGVPVWCHMQRVTLVFPE